MRIGYDAKTRERNLLTSWKCPSNPSIGHFSLGLDPLNIPQIYVWNGSHPYMRSGPWDGQIFIGIPEMASVYLDGFNIVDDKEGTFYLTFTYVYNQSIGTYYMLDSDGTLLEKYWSDEKEDWEVTWLAPGNDCNVYGKCGAFGSCNSLDSPICTCLRGFKPKYKEEWSRGNWTSGCIRKTLLQCERNNTLNEGGKKDGFLRLKTMKVPDFVEWSPALEDNCGSLCLNNCSCIAYSYYPSIGCMHWGGSLIDIQKFPQGGADLFIRVVYSELDGEKNMKVVLAITTITGSVTIAICASLSWRWISKRGGRKQNPEQVLFEREKADPVYSTETLLRENNDQIKVEELPLYCFQNVLKKRPLVHWWRREDFEVSECSSPKGEKMAKEQGKGQFKELMVIMPAEEEGFPI
ncbi:unnamed protein product [Ilex paraguariensis]|uniref:Apple domain-containing protein n=1 Tax=Ilex paraguariensis TaxID=185542 RepID=A0ABC8TM74_9AQUA